MNYFRGKKSYFPGIEQIKFEGTDSKNHRAFRWYDETRVVAGKPLKEHLRYAVAYWHSLCNTGEDPFGSGTRVLDWDQYKDPIDRAMNKLDAAFEFFTKLGVPFYCFHDTDLVGDGTVFEIEKRLEKIIPEALARQNETGVNLLWGTANVFSNPKIYERRCHKS